MDAASDLRRGRWRRQLLWEAPTAARLVALAAVLASVCVPPNLRASDDGLFPLVKPEQTRLRFHHPADLPHLPVPLTPPPPTLLEPREFRGTRLISLDEAIRVALSNSEVLRVFTGASAGSSGRTIYDAAIANQAVDQQRAAFDPNLTLNNSWQQLEPPAGALFQTVPGDPFSPVDSDIVGSQTENLNTTVALSQRNLLGGVAAYRFSNDRTFVSPGTLPLNPQRRFFNEVSYTQPLLRGRGAVANRVPILLARVDAERTFFQLSGATQELVRGVIDAYWNLVFARTDVWARKIQVEQSEEAFKRAEARKRVDLADITEVAQTRSALANFRAQLIMSEGNLLQAEAALLNILGLPPTLDMRLVPTSRPTTQKIDFDWTEALALAEERRPDLIELKLVLEADRQRLLLSRNQAQPTLDATALYRWNGIVGRTPGGSTRSSDGGQFTDWTLGINFAVPLGLRAERANIRSGELLLARDRANLSQGLHNTQHVLAANFRAIEQNYLQYEAFAEAREAARENLEAQFAAYRNEREQVLFVNVLQAISSFGNAVSAEASALLQYNSSLAALERETGTILETHGVFLLEDLSCSIGPHCLRVRRDRPRGRLYSTAHFASENAARYDDSPNPAEEAFDLNDAPKQRRPKGEAQSDDEDRPSGETEDEERPSDAPQKRETIQGTPLDLPPPRDGAEGMADEPDAIEDDLLRQPILPDRIEPERPSPERRERIEPKRPPLRSRLLGRQREVSPSSQATRRGLFGRLRR